MKRPLFSFVRLCAAVTLLSLSSSFAQLTPENIEAVKKKLKALKENLDTHLSTRNSSASSTFLAASADPRMAVDLYLKCVEKVEYAQEGKKDSEFREWKDGQADNFRDKRFLESLMLQLRYLGISCRAAELESIGEGFNEMMNFADSLARMEEIPTAALTQSCAKSVFAEAYNLGNLLGQSGSWESVPYSISGIYEKTILAHLRRNSPESLMNAWDRRIAQQTQLAANLAANVEKIERDARMKEGQEQRRARDALRSLYDRDASQMVKSHDKDDFLRETLPTLKWDRLKDKFYYVDEVSATQEMLAHVEEHLTHPLGEKFYKEFSDLINDAGIGSNRLREANNDTPAEEGN